MAPDRSEQRYHRWYAYWLRLYPPTYHQRFREEMEQTFGDLLRERSRDGKGLFGYVVWMFVETAEGIIRENLTSIAMKTITKRLIVWAVSIVLLLMIPLILTIRDGAVENVGWNWTPFDFVSMGALLFGAGLAYELVARKMRNGLYRAAVGLAVAASVLLVWISGAVGIIGNEGDEANLLYFVVIVVGLIGAVLSRLKPRGMSLTLYLAALAQFLVPIVALIIWGSDINWEPSLFGIFILNFGFVLLYAWSGLLFRRAGEAGQE